jgi:hypothetical protein
VNNQLIRAWKEMATFAWKENHENLMRIGGVPVEI